MADGKTPLNYEIESYASTTGALIAWVQIPSLSPTTDNTIYMYYGNASAPAVPATTAQNVWSNGYAGVWHLPNGTTLSGADSTGVNNGTLQGSPTAVTGQIDGAAGSFSNTNYITTGTNNSQNLINDITVSGWVKVTAIPATGGAPIYEYGSGGFLLSGADRGYGLFLRNTTGSNVDVYWDLSGATTDTSNTVKVYSGFNINDGVWHFISGTTSGNNHTIYVDGINLKNATVVTGDRSVSATGIMGRDDNGGDYLTGSIDDVRVSNVARTSDWIKTEYANQSAPATFESIAGEETQQGTTFNSTWYSSAWGYRKPIVIDHRKINKATNTTTPLTNFPVLVSITDTDLKNYASTTGADILFTASDGKTKLNHEIESYNSTTGVLLAWVQIPSLVSTVDTTVYMYFGNASETGNEQNSTAVWNSNYLGVYHLNEANGATALDSTTNGNNLTSTSYPTATANGKLGPAQSFNGTSNFLSKTWTSPAGSMTLSAWVNVSSFVSNREASLAGFSGYPQISLTTNASNVAKTQLAANSYTTGLTTITTGSWWYITGVCDQAGNSNHVYVNGVLDDSTHVNFTCGSNSPFLVGYKNTQIITAVEDEIRVSNSARTADWIKTEYLNQSSPSTFYAKGALQTQNHTAQQSNEQIVNRGWYRGSSSSAGASGVGGWNYRMPITISHNMVGSSTTATLQNFPVLVSVTNANLKSVSNGGGVASTSAADIVFTDSDGGTKLAHEIESYDAVNGTLIAWVKVPILSTTIDHTIYIYYGNSTANLPSQQNASAVWDSNYKGVWHLSGVTGTGLNDSTVNANNGANTGAIASSTGQVDGAVAFDGNTTYVKRTAMSGDYTNGGTVSFWAYNNSFTGNDGFIVTSQLLPYIFVDSGTNKIRLMVYNSAGGGGVNLTGSVIPSSQWVFYTAVWSPNGGTIYKNGANIDAQTTTITGTLRTSAGDLYIGSDRGNTGRSIDGTMDEVQISSIARSADWITTEYLNQSAPGTYVTLGAQQTSGTAVAVTNWYNASWTNRRTITIDHRKVSQVSGTTLVNFPMLFSTTDNEFKMPSGKVKENHGYDFVFTDSDGKTVLNSEIESYASSTGQLIAWVKIPQLLPFADHTIYLYYGNASATAPSSAFTQGVWDSNYKGVWHMSNVSSPALDSTINANNAATSHGSPGFGANGNISKAVSFGGSADISTAAVVTNVVDNFTMSVWLNPGSSASGQYAFYNGNVSAGNGWAIKTVAGNKWHDYFRANDFGVDFGSLGVSKWQMVTIAEKIRNLIWLCEWCGIFFGK